MPITTRSIELSLKRFVVIGIFVLLSSLIFHVEIGVAGPRLLQQIPGPDQEVTSREGLPLIISKSTNNVAISPESIIVEQGRFFRFTVIIVNLTDDPLDFAMKDIRVFSNKKDMELLSANRIVDNERKEYSREKLKISKDEEKILGPYVKDKLERLRNSLLKEQTIPPKEMLKGIIAIELPMGSNNLTIEITTPKDSHRFDFNIMEL